MIRPARKWHFFEKARKSDTCLQVNSIAPVRSRRTSDAEMDAPLMQLLEVATGLAVQPGLQILVQCFLLIMLPL